MLNTQQYIVVPTQPPASPFLVIRWLPVSLIKTAKTQPSFWHCPRITDAYNSINSIRGRYSWLNYNLIFIILITNIKNTYRPA